MVLGVNDTHGGGGGVGWGDVGWCWVGSKI